VRVPETPMYLDGLPQESYRPCWRSLTPCRWNTASLPASSAWISMTRSGRSTPIARAGGNRFTAS
jgi:hypothetical protein